MPRSKTAKTSRKRRKKTIKEAKGYRWGRKSKYKASKQALMKAWSYAYRDRKTRKRAFRRLWQIQINAAVRSFDLSYSKFIHLLKENNIKLNRKVLAQLANEEPKVFEKIVKEVKK